MTTLKILKVKWGGGALRLKFKAFTLAEGASHVDMFRNYRKRGFTLAEVLITLGIIGVVAALTLPTLIHNHNKKVIETRLKKFYSSINQAILLSEADNGDKKDWADFDRTQNPNCIGGKLDSEACVTDFYNKYLKKYLKTAENARYISSLSGLCVFFADGSAVLIKYAGGDYTFYPYAKSIDKKNNVNSKDYFWFALYPAGAAGKRNEYFYNKGVEPYIEADWDGTEEGLKADARNYAKIIQLNNWQIPDDYPIKI